MALPRISVVTPSFNQARYIEETIRSVLEQGYPDLQYIVIDGGSQDGSADIIRKYEGGIDYWVSEPDTGQSNAINKGLHCADGEIVCWLNSDDLFLPDALQKVGRAFAGNPSIDVVTGYSIRTDTDLRLLFNHYTPAQSHWLARQGVFYYSQMSTFWRRTLHAKIGYLDDALHYSMDADLWVRLLAAGVRIQHMRDFLALWRFHDTRKGVKDGKGKEAADREHARLRAIHEKMRFANPTRLGRVTYRMLKVLTGDYVRDVMFRLRWGGRPLAEFIRSLSR